MNQIDGMEFFKRLKEARDQGAPAFTFDSLTLMDLGENKVLYNPPQPDPWVPPPGSLDAYYAADMDMPERGAAFAAANPNASFIETLIYLINGVTIRKSGGMMLDPNDPNPLNK